MRSVERVLHARLDEGQFRVADVARPLADDNRGSPSAAEDFGRGHDDRGIGRHLRRAATRLNEVRFEQYGLAAKRGGVEPRGQQAVANRLLQGAIVVLIAGYENRRGQFRGSAKQRQRDQTSQRGAGRAANGGG